MKNNFALLLVVLLATMGGKAAAQEVLSPPAGAGAGDLPPDLAEPSSSGHSGASSAPAAEGETIEPMPESYDDGTVAGTFAPYMDNSMAACNPVLFESSGSWLRRGFWYAEGDYLLLNRSWDKKGLLFAFEGGVGSAPGFTNNTGVGQPGFGPVLTLNSLIIDGSKPGADGMARVTLGRFLFRDEKNRDHAIQATYTGGGDWKQNSRVESATAGGLNVNDFIDRVNPSFDGAQAMSFNYQTTLDTVEANYTVKSRLGRDQMVLQPDGNWVRTAHTSQTFSYLAGMRFLEVGDKLDILAERNPDIATTEGGSYFVDTKNRLFGGQLGISVSQETARWSLSANVKGGSYWNRMHLDSRFTAGTEAAPTSGFVNNTEDNLSFVGEAQVLGKWHLRPNVSLRVGVQALFVSSLALAPHQVNFLEGGYPPIAGDDDIVCLGTSFGIEAYR